ncbi:OrU19, partial [Eciton burchellii]
FEWAVKLNRYALTSIGLWPRSKQTAREKFMCNLRVLLTFLTISLITAIPTVHSLIRIRSSIMLIIDNLQLTMPVITIILKIVIFWWKREAITPLVDMITIDWVKPKTSWERMMMITRAQTARIITMFGYGMMGVSLIVATTLPICGVSLRYFPNNTAPAKLLPFQIHYVYDTIKSPQYEFTYVLQVISMFLSVLSYTGVDNFFSLLVFHICGQLDILRDRIMHLDKYTDYADILKRCVMEHTRLFRAIIVIEDTFNVMLLVLFLYFGIFLTSYGFLILSLLEDENYLSISRLVYLIMLVINAFIHMCVYCAIGEILASQCNEIHYAAYCNEWYSLDSRNARCIILFMIRTNEPLYLTAGKVFPITMATFCNLIKTSAGYVSVLLTTRASHEI